MKVISPEPNSHLCELNDQVVCRSHRGSHRLAGRPAATAACVSMCLILSLSLGACGNKGDLYLNELELSEEQQKLLDELDDETVKKKQTGNRATPE